MADLLADSNSILNSGKNHFCQLLKVPWANEVRQTEIHKTDPLVSEPTAVEVE
jgi:hypothetical protein